MTAFVANTNNLDLIGLRNASNGAYVNDATVTVVVKDSTGNNVSGETWPLSMIYVSGSEGNYRGILSNSLSFSSGRNYTAEISVDAGSNRIAFWVFDFFAIERREVG
jgi:hypothetical protein